MPKPTIAQLKARIGGLEKEVVELRAQIRNLDGTHAQLSHDIEVHKSTATALGCDKARRETELRAALTTIKLLATN